MPSFQSILPSIVEPTRLGSAFALNSTRLNFARIIGPAIASVVMIAIGAPRCFALDTVSHLPFIPVSVKDVFHEGAGHFGGALSAYGANGLLGAVALLATEGHVERRRLCMSFAAAWSDVVAGASFNHSDPLIAA